MMINNLQVDIKFVPSDSWGSLLQHFTGSKAHNIRLREYALTKKLSLSEYGIKKSGKLIKYADESEFYSALGMDWIPPELREDQGEIEAAVARHLPHLVTVKDIKGDLHNHTNYHWASSHDTADYSVKDLIEHALALGFTYLGIGDHNPSLSSYSDKQIVTEVKKRTQAIKKLDSNRLHLLTSLEVDIRPDGSLALPDAAFVDLDYVVASVHSGFDQSSSQLTHRVLKALSHPKVKILGHPTGRLINSRPGYSLDWSQIFPLCRESNIALEINSHPARLDLDGSLVKAAISSGVKVAINTDSHRLTDFNNLKLGTATARRGWATAADVINTWTWPKLKAFLL